MAQEDLLENPVSVLVQIYSHLELGALPKIFTGGLLECTENDLHCAEEKPLVGGLVEMPHERTASALAQARCGRSVVSPRDLAQFYASSYQPFYNIVGRNLSYEIIPSFDENGPTQECKNWTIQ